MRTQIYPQELVLEDYGVKLKRLTHDKIELLRQWRNDPKIQRYMLYREYITPEMQEKWFQKINNDRNFYFIIEYDGKEVGCVNIKDIDYNKKCGECGVLIYDDAYLCTDLAYRAHLVMCDYIYNVCKLDYTYSHVLLDNRRAIRFAEYLGFKEDKMFSKDKCVFYRITAKEYLSNHNREHFIKRWEHLHK